MSAIRTATGRHIYYDDIGEGPPILLLAGWSGYRRSFLASLPTAIAARFRTVAMDHRDAGESDPEPEYYTAADMADDVVALLDALGIARAHVMGGSMGGTVALQLALDHPDRVDHLILLKCLRPQPRRPAPDGGAAASTRTLVDR